MEMLAGGALLVLVGSATGEWGRLDPAAVSGRSLLALGYLIAFGSCVGFTAYIWLLRHVEVAKVSTYAYVNPVVAIALGALFVDEEVTWLVGVAAVLIVVSVAGTVRREAAAPVEQALPQPVESRP